MRFDTYIPCNALTPFVNIFAISESGASTYKVLPGTGVVIGFQYKGKLSHLIQGEEIQLAPSGLTGLHDRYRIFKNSVDTGTVLVYFKEGGAAAFFKQPIHELFSQSISLDNFMIRSELLILEERLCEAKQDITKIKIVEEFLISRMRPQAPDNLVLTALAIIHKNKGDIKIKALAQQLGTSQSPLEKRFRQCIGTSPKKFASIVRFKHIVERFKLHYSLTELGYEAGFYDQAHFIKEFKSFTGDTPATFLSSK